jgi:hypothetical protein
MLRFTIRDLLWLMVVVVVSGVCFGWWVDHEITGAKYRFLLQQFEFTKGHKAQDYGIQAPP